MSMCQTFKQSYYEKIYSFYSITLCIYICFCR